MNPSVANVLLVALGGALGAVSRYGVSLAAVRLFGPGVPVGTWVANAVGCVLVGFVVALAPSERVRLAVVVGGLGGFTTFSSYSAETLALWSAGRPGLAAANAVGSVVVGLAGAAAGLMLGRAVAA